MTAAKNTVCLWFDGAVLAIIIAPMLLRAALLALADQSDYAATCVRAIGSKAGVAEALDAVVRQVFGSDIVEVYRPSKTGFPF